MIPPPINDFHKAIGQYISYQTALKQIAPERQLCIAIPSSIYENFIQEPFPKEVIKDYKIKMVVDDIEIGELSKWLPDPR